MVLSPTLANPSSSLCTKKMRCTGGNISGLIQQRSADSVAWVSQPLRPWEGPLLLCKVPESREEPNYLLIFGGSYPLFRCIISCLAINPAEAGGARTRGDSRGGGAPRASGWLLPAPALLEDAVAPQTLGNEEASLQMAVESQPEPKPGVLPRLTSAKARILQTIGVLLLGAPLGTRVAFPLAMRSGWEDAGLGPKRPVPAKGPLLAPFARLVPSPSQSCPRAPITICSALRGDILSAILRHV